MKLVHSLLTVVAILCLAVQAQAQQKRVSPPDVAGAVVDGNRVTIFYSRPFTKDPKTGQPRKIWGEVIPFDKPWRLGANEATTMITQKDIKLGDADVPAGAYTLFMLPAADGSAKLIINKQIGQWGTQYDQKQDLARVDMKKETADKNDQLLITVGKDSGGGGIIKVVWDEGAYSVHFDVKK
jgi:hypothetical protein